MNKMPIEINNISVHSLDRLSSAEGTSKDDKNQDSITSKVEKHHSSKDYCNTYKQNNEGNSEFIFADK